MITEPYKFAIGKAKRKNPISVNQKNISEKQAMAIESLPGLTSEEWQKQADKLDKEHGPFRVI